MITQAIIQGRRRGTRRQSSGTRRQSGGTLVGFIIGLVVGLAIALAAALTVTKGPVPFVNKVMHNTGSSAPTEDDVTAGKLPDPNKSLYTKDPAIAPVPTLSAPPAAPASADPVSPPPPSSAAAEAPSAKPSYLQVGAYKNSAEADNMKAKLALLGIEASITSATLNGGQMYRVRVGPFTRAEELNRTRQQLIENGVEVAVASSAAKPPAAASSGSTPPRVVP